MADTEQTRRADRSETIAFRSSREVKALVRAAASRHEVLPSDWLRARIEQALVDELGPDRLGREPLTAEALGRARPASDHSAAEG